MVTLQAALAAFALSAAGQTVLYDFQADWCAPCRAMNPTIEALEKAGYPVRRVNIDREKDLAEQYKVRNIPCFVMVVDGQEVDRVVGGTSYSHLERLCKLGASAAKPAPQSMIARNAPAPQPFAPSPRPQASAPFVPSPPAASSDAFDWQPGRSSPVQPVSWNAPAAPHVAAAENATDAALLAATVRLYVQDPGGRSCGSGTIINARGGKALILTCGHIFRDSQGKGPITVDLFGPNGPRQTQGTLLSYDSESRDIGLVMIDAPEPVASIPVAPPNYRTDPNASVVSVGCNNGAAPTPQRSRIVDVSRSRDATYLKVAGQPVEGRSGGGLFSAEGYLIGVCFAADPADRVGYYSALDAIHAELDRMHLSDIYQAPGAAPRVSPDATAPQLLASAAPTAPPQPLPGPEGANWMHAPTMPAGAALAALPSPERAAPSNLASLTPQESAALEEIHRRLKEGAEVTCVIHPRNDPNARSEVITLDRASAEFIRQLAAAARPTDKPIPTSLDIPGPRKKLLEWSAERDSALSRGK